jgi:predicted DCC family thiol-disulfide oxidoreductase YuxK
VVSHSTTLTIWYDGACPLCARTRRWVERADAANVCVFRDFRAADPDALPVDPVRLEAEMWVEAPGEPALGGFLGLCRVLERLPRWRWIAVLGRTASGRWFGSLLYRWVAKNRYRVFAAECEDGCGLGQPGAGTPRDASS